MKVHSTGSRYYNASILSTLPFNLRFSLRLNSAQYPGPLSHIYARGAMYFSYIFL
ncbi:hypothetical protein HOLleu_04434 [Holothuria leucospilota]|uniref:Uncharacterized protein n=1 Tax=Holothuria leucospilota TaxID=206669 RepID=A0A9Q1CTU7_HOLLE|nr:hypothetical protein HOLleu_04434 [Holothuria leucospilota]